MGWNFGDILDAISPVLPPDTPAFLHGDRTITWSEATKASNNLARGLIADGRTVVLGAADTFRAAAADQLEQWAPVLAARGNNDLFADNGWEIVFNFAPNGEYDSALGRFVMNDGVLTVLNPSL